MDKASFFILNIFLNSFLAFFTAVFLIETVIFIFRMKQGRATALLRMIPILKLPLDLCFYDFSRWAYIQGINPLHCEEGSRTLSVLFGWAQPPTNWLHLPLNSAIQFTVTGDLTFTISDVIGYMMNQNHLKLFAASLVFLSICFFIRKIVTYHRCIKTIHALKADATPMTTKIRNPYLLARIKKGNYPIFTSSTLQGSPFVAGLFSPTIYLPGHLTECLSRKEYEAVLAHEIEHIRNRDIFIRLMLDIIMSIFWWVPTKWLRNKIEEGQEISADHRCRKYGVEAVDLASAICKSAKLMQTNLNPVFVHRLTQHKTLKRVKMLLQPLSSRFHRISLIATALAIGIAFLLILFGRFWLF